MKQGSGGTKPSGLFFYLQRFLGGTFDGVGSMATHDKYEKGPTHGFSARGYDAAYAADRARAEKELASTMAGPKHPLAEDPTAKNPNKR